jgi:hypothetical protein
MMEEIALLFILGEDKTTGYCFNTWRRTGAVITMINFYASPNSLDLGYLYQSINLFLQILLFFSFRWIIGKAESIDSIFEIGWL